MTWSNFNILNGVIAAGRKIAWLGKDNFVSGSSSVITVLINEAGMPLFHLLLIYFRTSASLECAKKWLMARHSMKTTPKLCWCWSSLLKRCSLMKHKVPVSPFSKPSCRYVQICSAFHRGVLHLFLYNHQPGQKLFCWRDYWVFWIFIFILPFYCICFPLVWSTQQWKLNAQGWAALCPSAAQSCAGSSWVPGSAALWESCGQLPNWLFKNSILQAVSSHCRVSSRSLCWVFVSVECFSASLSLLRISNQNLCSPICVCGRSWVFLYIYFFYEFESYQLKLEGSWYLLGTYFIW